MRSGLTEYLGARPCRRPGSTSAPTTPASSRSTKCLATLASLASTLATISPRGFGPCSSR